MSILTINIKHHADLTAELARAVKVAEYAVANKDCNSSKDVKHFGLPSEMSNQLLRKYGRNKTIKKVNPKGVKLIVPGRATRMSGTKISIKIRGYDFELAFENKSHHRITKINCIELDETYAHVSFEVVDAVPIVVDKWIGVDLNMTSHLAVVAVPTTGKVYKLGKRAPHVRKKYSSLRRKFQKEKLYVKLKQLKGRERNKEKDIN